MATLAAFLVAVLLAGRADPGVLRNSNLGELDSLARAELLHRQQTFALVVLGTAAAAFVVCGLLSVASRRARAAVLLFVAPASVVAATMPVYWLAYRDWPEFSHVNVPAEHRWSQILGVGVALLVYSLLVNRRSEPAD